MLCLIVRRIVLVAIVAVLATSAVATAQPTIEQVNQALDLAEKAARHGLTDLSMQAVRRSLAYGPPTVSTAVPDKPLRHFGARVDTSRELPLTARQRIDQRIPSTVNQLADTWGRSSEPNTVYAAVRDVVFPPGRPTQAFLYSLPIKLDPLQPDRIPLVPSLVDTLLHWAEEAGQLDDLRQQLNDRDLKRSAPAMAVGLLVGLKSNDLSAVQRYTDGISQLADVGLNRQAAEFLTTVGIKMRRVGQSPIAAAQLLETAGRALQKIDQLEKPKVTIGPTVLVLAARCWFSVGDSKRGVAMLREYLGDAKETEFVSNGAARKVDIVGKELFSRGLNKEGLELLGPKLSAHFERRFQISASDDVAEIDWSPRSQFGDQPLARATPLSDVAADEESIREIWLCRLDLTTNTSKRLFAFPDFQHVASPAVSSDGVMLCFEASFPGEAITSGSRIYLMEISTGKMRCLGQGTLPSWSPGGKRIVFSSFLPTRGVWITKLSDGDSQLIDRGGWAATWSPNGSMIAFSRYVGRVWDLYVFDIVENEYFSVFGNKPCPFSTINSGFQWAPDSKSLLLKTSGRELAEVPVLSSKSRTAISLNFELQNQFASHVTEGLIASGKRVKDSPDQLFRVDRSQDKASTPVPGQFPDRRNTGAAWMPDGNSLLYISKPNRK